MIIRSILAKSAAKFFLAPENGGGSGGGVTLEEQLSQARADLATAQGSVTALTTERDTARSQITSLTAERDNLQAQFDSLTTTANDLRAQVTSLTGERDTARTELATAKGDLTLATANVTRLEKLCGVKGINPSAAAPAIEQPANDRQALVARLESATDAHTRGIAAMALRKFDATAAAAR